MFPALMKLMALGKTQKERDALMRGKFGRQR